MTMTCFGELEPIVKNKTLPTQIGRVKHVNLGVLSYQSSKRNENSGEVTIIHQIVFTRLIAYSGGGNLSKKQCKQDF